MGKRRRALLFKAALVLLGLTALWAAIFTTMAGMPGDTFSGPLPPLTEQERLAEERLTADLTALAVRIGERNFEHLEALQAAAAYLERQIAAEGLSAVRRAAAWDERDFFNLEVDVRRGSDTQALIVLGAHYDSFIGSPGADDNASGVVIALELLRQLKTEPTRHNLRVVFFVNEEPPFFRTPVMGSLVYARQLADEEAQVAAMLSLECLGYYSSTAGSQRYPSRLLGWLLPDTANFVGFAGDLRSRSLVRQSIRGFRQSVRFPSEGMVAPAIVPGIGWSDHWSFWQAGYPGIVVSGTALFRNANYHEATDTADTLDVEAMARVTTGLVGVVRHLDATLSR